MAASNSTKCWTKRYADRPAPDLEVPQCAIRATSSRPWCTEASSRSTHSKLIRWLCSMPGPQDEVHGGEPRPHYDGMGLHRGGAPRVPARRSTEHRYVVSSVDRDARMLCCCACTACSHRPEASVYTEMNAITKGVSLGKYEEGKGKGMEASKGGSQPYVDLMGRRSVATPLKAEIFALIDNCSPPLRRIHIACLVPLPTQNVRLLQPLFLLTLT